MLKGHVFLYQIFGNEICAKVFNSLSYSRNGILKDYGDEMEVTYNGTELTISSGLAMIGGRPVQETSSSTIDAGTTSLYCKLCLTVDLDAENTTSQFNQGYYEVVTGVSDYPELTQDDIVNNNSGKFQFELAKFTTGINGIDNFEDTRELINLQDSTGIPTNGVIGFEGSTIPDGFEEVDNIFEYSANEIKIGTWFGKPLYRKVFVIEGTEIQSGKNTINHNISDLEELVRADLKLHSTGLGSGNSNTYMSPMYNSGTSYKIMTVTYVTKTNFILYSGDHWSDSYKWFVTFEYTKTTDTV